MKPSVGHSQVRHARTGWQHTLGILWLCAPRAHTELEWDKLSVGALGSSNNHCQSLWLGSFLLMIIWVDLNEIWLYSTSKNIVDTETLV